MQFQKLHKKIDALQPVYGDKKLNSIFGAGCVENPNLMLVFMNPTAKNISAHEGWKGIRAPWLGTKSVWRFLYKLGLISKVNFEITQKLEPNQWTPKLALQIYGDVKNNGCYVTNLAKCTQVNAKPVKSQVFRKYLDILKHEITLANPKRIITFGGLVSSVILGKLISVGGHKMKPEILAIGNKKFSVFPVYYPVGQGMRNMPLAIKRIKAII